MKTIIAATDFSQPGDNAVEYAFELAVLFNCKLILVHAFTVRPPVYLLEEPFVSFEEGPQDERIEEEKKISLEKLEKLKLRFSEKLMHIFNVSYVVQMGSPEQVIDEVAVSENADLIVVGIIGEAGKIKQRFVGSTAINVARNESIPTFIIPENIKYYPIRKMSFACDLKEAGKEELLFHAQHYGTVFDAELEIVTVEEEDELVVEEQVEVDQYIDDHLPDVKHTITHLEGRRVAKKLEDHFYDHPTDVILLSPKKHPIFYHLFNPSITNELAFNARTPILTIK